VAHLALPSTCLTEEQLSRTGAFQFSSFLEAASTKQQTNAVGYGAF
jgi:hypothetical protein